MRRVLALVCAAILLLTASGCASLFDREVYTEEPYEGPAAEPLYPEDDTANAISNYASLRRAVSRLVTEHAESAELQFQNYDGTISQDLSAACWEVKSSTPLGAYAVDYISYDLSRIVSYYQAEIHITYKRSAYQMSLLERTENLSAVRSRLDRALREGETYLVLELSAAALTADTVADAVARAYYADPLCCPVLPEVEAALYPESGVTRILEVTLDYGMDSESLTARREAMSAALDEAVDACMPEEEEAEPTAYLAALYDYLADVCTVDETAGATAWDALTAGTASSEGIAMALEAGCQAGEIPCRLVSGRLNGESHAWNIVSLGDRSYHLDASARNEEPVFLLGDEDIWGAYWWDTSEYPACSAAYGAEEESSGEMPSAEPSEKDSGL